MQGWSFAKACVSVPEGAQHAVYLSLGSEGRQQLLGEVGSIGESLLREVLRQREGSELMILAGRADLTEAQQLRLARNSLKRVREALLRRSDLTAAVLAQIAAADDPDTSASVFFHRSTSDEVRARILAGESCKPRGRKKVGVPRRLTEEYYLSARQAYLAPAYATAPQLRTAAIASRFLQGLDPAQQLAWALRMLAEEEGRYAPRLFQGVDQLHPQIAERLGGPAADLREGARSRQEVVADARAALEALAGEAAADPSVLAAPTPPELQAEVIVDKTRPLPPRYDDAAALLAGIRDEERGIRSWISDLTHDLPWEEILEAHLEEELPASVLPELCERPDVPGALLSALVTTHPRLVAATRGIRREHVLALIAGTGTHYLQGKVLADLRITGHELATHALPARAAFRYVDAGAKDPLWQQRTAHELSQLVVGALGDDATLWTSYVGLLESFEGSLIELLEVVELTG